MCRIYSNAQHVTGDITSCQSVKSVSNTLSQPDKRTIHTTVVISAIVHELFGVFRGHRYINHLIRLCLLNSLCIVQCGAAAISISIICGCSRLLAIILVCI